MPRTAISGLVCTTFLVLLGCPAVPQEPAGKGADTEPGQLTFNNACRTCHTTKGGDNRLGPNLHNIIGRKAGSLQNYGYSSAMKGADFVWDKERLDRFIATPDEVVPGNNMKPYGAMSFDAHLMFCAKNLERMGDHATNIAEAVHYMVKGETLLRERAKADFTSMLTVAMGRT